MSVTISSMNQVKYWINTIPQTSCALFEDESDLTDGRAFSEIVSRVLKVELSSRTNSKLTALG